MLCMRCLKALRIKKPIEEARRNSFKSLLLILKERSSLFKKYKKKSCPLKWKMQKLS